MQTSYGDAQNHPLASPVSVLSRKEIRIACKCICCSENWNGKGISCKQMLTSDGTAFQSETLPRWFSHILWTGVGKGQLERAGPVS